MAWAALLCHETAHLWALKRTKTPFETLEFLPFGGVIQLSGLLSLEDECLVAGSGPLCSLALALLSLRIPGAMADLFFQMNAALFITNILPVLPLDGGRIFRACLARKHGYQKATARAIRLARILSLCLGLASLALFLGGVFSLLSLLLAFFVYYRSTIFKNEAWILWLEDFLGRSNQLQEKPLQGEYWVVSGHHKLEDVFQVLNPRRYHRVLVLDEHLHHLGVLEEDDLLEAFMKGKLKKKIQTLLHEE